MARAPRIPHRHRPALLQALAHPVGRAVAQVDLDQARREIKINLYTQEEGEDSTHLLSMLAWMLALGLKLEACVNGDTPRLRRMHGALRSVQAMCLAGYGWQSTLAYSLDTALVAAEQVADELGVHFDIAANDAQCLYEMVKGHRITPDSVMGSELYDQFRRVA